MATKNRSTRSKLESVKLEYHHGKLLKPAHRLPFVGGKGHNGGISFWNVPASGGFPGGTETGDALASSYLKFLRDHPEDVMSSVLLQWIALDMCERYARVGGAERESLAGQITGFFSGFSRFAQEYPQARPDLDQISEAEILSRANAGLAGWSRTAELLKGAA